MLRFPKSLAFAAGLASATGFAPLDLWPVTLAGFALLLHLVHEGPGLRGALARGYWFAVGHFIVGLNWIAGAFAYQQTMPVWLGWIAVVLLSFYLAIYPAMAAGLAWRWGRQRAAAFVLIFASAWIVTEWLRATMFTGFAWNPLGVAALHAGNIATLSQWIGTFALSSLLVLAAGAIWMLTRRAFVAGGAIAAALVALALLPRPALEPAGGPVVRVIQPNIGQQDKHKPAYEKVNFAKLAGLTGSPRRSPRLILWPEAAIPDYLEEEAWARERIAKLMGPRDMLLTGGVALVYDRDDRLIAARNSTFAMNSTGLITGRYDKAHLVPYGEYLPARPILSAIGLSRLVPGDLDFWPGPGARTLDVPGFARIGVQICYEIVFPAHVVDRSNRPDFIFNPSNDAWFGAWGPPQHLAQARLRAIEEGLPVVRATPTGISAMIDAQGRLLAALPYRKAGFIEMRLPRAEAPTVFARYGNILSFAFAIFLGALGVALTRRRR